MTTATLPIKNAKTNEPQDVTLSTVLSMLSDATRLLHTLLPTPVPPPAAPPRAAAPSFARFPRTALFLVQTELVTASTGADFCALATTTRDVRDAEPRVAAEASLVLRQVTARATGRGLHLQNLRRRLTSRAVAATPAVSKPKRARVVAEVCEEAPETMRSAPEPRRVAPEASPSSAFPFLAEVAEERRVVVFGGRDARGVIANLATDSGIDVERIATDVFRPRQIAAFAERVRAGHVGAIVAVNGFMAHAAIIPVIAAAKLAGVPLAYAGKGGLRKFLRAFDELERQLRVAARPVVAV